MNFADPQAAISTPINRDGFDVYSVVVAGAGLHPRHFRRHACHRAGPSELTKVHDAE